MSTSVLRDNEQEWVEKKPKSSSGSDQSTSQRKRKRVSTLTRKARPVTRKNLPTIAVQVICAGFLWSALPRSHYIVALNSSFVVMVSCCSCIAVHTSKTDKHCRLVSAIGSETTTSETPQESFSRERQPNGRAHGACRLLAGSSTLDWIRSSMLLGSSNDGACAASAAFSGR